ncbi:MAG TPA: hypothetical protein IAB04_05465 [Candidatus Avimonoglobus intestinipullorum]|uniref:Uncharacterized protein n=1 Tax=Candidatus Avimonoglobus intestinipullorum TaxID=2840699 RepID=A0A9D1LVL9_9FIRM|nr:hypothetical protein [Candidatus Avimonoglobus intestinipullorum]
MFTLGPPPERTGDDRVDLNRLYSWCNQLCIALMRTSNYTGVIVDEKEDANDT